MTFNLKPVKISIITTIYKAEKDLPRLLDSMMALQSQDLEFFLIDNGSPDRCGEICTEYAARDKRFYVRSLKDNIGYIKARMLGIHECHGDYVGFCDSDDYLEPQGYDHVVEQITKKQCDLYIGAHKFHYGEDVYLMPPPYQTGDYTDDSIREVILPQAFGHLKDRERLHGFMWKHVYKRSIILDSGINLIEELKPWEDQIFNIDVIQRCQKIVVDHQVIYNYFANSGSVTSSMIKNFDAEDFWRKTRLLYVNKRERATTEIEHRASANATMVNMDLMVVCLCKKTTIPSSTVAKTLRSLLHKDDVADQILTGSSRYDLSKRLRFVNYCLRWRLYRFLVWVVRRKLEKVNEHR